MTRKFYFILFFITAITLTQAQSPGYDIKFNLKGNKDTVMYLVKYVFDQQYIADTAKHVKNGQARFKGKKNLDKGVYVLVSEAKSIYFDFFINENTAFAINADMSDMVNSLKSVGSKENEEFFTYIKYITNKNIEFGKAKDKTKGMNKADSIKVMQEKSKNLTEEVKKFQDQFMQKNKGTYLYDVLNLQKEKELPANEVPKASNGRPDSVYSYYWFKSHYWDGVNFSDDRILRTPFFDDRIKSYFDYKIVQHPDTVIQEIDKILARCNENSDMYRVLLGHFTYKAEQSKIMGFDKVFCHMARKYIISGHAKGVYTDETVTKIKERADIVCNLLLEAKVPELYMVDTVYGKQVLKMGFDTAKTSKSVTDLYYKNLEKLTPMFKSLYEVNAKYTILAFWASDCGHCQTEIPELHEEFKELKKKGIDVKVYAVETKEDFERWRKFLVDKKLTDFINVFDPIHLNNLKEKFDIYATPFIYVLDKDKRIKAKHVSAKQVKEIVEMLENIEKLKKK
ncbi:MAG: redoxin domain-containing protein [Bacteroidetes bacterium]|nr:redoxin domain-containing protein [Bacteroidota bacterium]